MELESVVIFIDEVEEIAGSRSGRPNDPAHGVTNELLKLIPAFREHDERLLICATNSVDVHRLVAATEMCTPADIEFAARKGAQSAFEREIDCRRGERADTADYLVAIGDTRPTLTEAVLAEFEEDIALRTRR